MRQAGKTSKDIVVRQAVCIAMNTWSINVRQDKSDCFRLDKYILLLLFLTDYEQSEYQ